VSAESRSHVDSPADPGSLWLRGRHAGPALRAPNPVTTAQPRRRRRRPARQRPLIVDILAALAGLGLGITIALGITAESAGSLSAPGGIATAIGRVAGLLAAYAMVIVVLLVARIPPLERAIGQDRLVAWHRRLGPWPLYLLIGHAVFITVGYARVAHDGVLHQFGQLLWTYPGILAATVGGVLLVAAGVTSYRLARRRMAYETWWSVHLYAYLALFLSFSHQIDTGASFVGHPVARAWWTAIWVGTLVTVVAARIGLPVWRSLYHRLRVVDVTPEGPDTISVVMEGRHLHRLPVYGGQFFQWRFLLPGMWWQAHPFSISAVPVDDHIRITVKNLGDHSAALAKLHPGTRVAVEGPYGSFTPDARQGDKLVLVGAGVGSAPILSLLQDLPAHSDVVVLLRASTEQELILRDEIAQEVRRRAGRLLELPGSRREVPLDRRALRGLISDLRRRDAYVCGPEAFTASLATSLEQAGVPANRIHAESFAF
jgi:ferredoxin-NADP reductase/DMSO/TMAO reductase YedYZ heme-binding membrane subunit